ncbi:MAG TPA: hypothetical protein VK724_08770 [Bryobacteraceae bacterium]|nr:hypothetical protein [Bryobacteraceae bacterium]
MAGSGTFVAWLRRALPFLSIAIVIGVVYDGSIFYGRWRDARAGAKAVAAKEAQDDRGIVDALGGDRLKILDFYASPPTVRRGEHSLICYGVNAAQTVRIDPPVEQLHPAVSHCLQVTPEQSTDYKLTIGDAAGHTLSQSLTIQVAR